MKQLLCFLFFIAVLPAQAQRQIGFLIAIDEKPPLDTKKFKAVECQYEIQCYPVYSVKENETRKFEIQTVAGKSHWVTDGELDLKYEPFADFLSTAMLDFIGHPRDLRADPEKPDFPTWLESVNIPKNIDVLKTKRIGDQIWLEVDFLQSGRCGSGEKKSVGKAWVPVFKPDHKLNVEWFARGC